MNHIGRTILVFLTGLGIGAGIAALFAPRSGEETREWIADRAERKLKVLRRVGRRSVRLPYRKMQSGANAFEISEIHEVEIARRS
jgi:gas vesicle protein